VTSGGFTMEQAMALQTFKEPVTPEERRTFIRSMVDLATLDDDLKAVAVEQLIRVFAGQEKERGE